MSEFNLRIPQLRVLCALMPENPDTYWTEWPMLTRGDLGVRAGYTPISGSITRALNGLREGSSSGPPFPGLIALSLVEEVNVNLDGVQETNYRITKAGVEEYLKYISKKPLPPVKDSSICINERYKK